MSEVQITATLRDGRRVALPCVVDARDLATLKKGTDDSIALAQELTLRTLRMNGLVTFEDSDLDSAVSTWAMMFDPIRKEDKVEQVKAPPDRRLAKCRSMLELATGFLPLAERDEALDEWTDEIETASAKGLPIFRRTCSIILRSLPVLALRSRLPKRAPRGGG